MWFYYVFLVIYLLAGGYFSGYITSKKTANACAWINVIFAVGIAWLISSSFPLPVVRMLCLISILFLSMKVVVYTFAGKRLGFIQWLCFSLFWVGMDPGPFRTERRCYRKISGKAVLYGVLCIVIGWGLLSGCAILLNSGSFYSVCGLLGLAGCSLILHFGFLRLLTVFWHACGVCVRPLFHSPWKSRSLSAFWGRNWNMAFIEMTNISIYGPLSRKLNRTIALPVVFLISGLFHEVAISLPVESGYGKPLLYFMIQGALVSFEKQIAGKRPDFLKRYGRIWTFAILFLPLPLLFPPAFIGKIVFPFLSCCFP